MKHIYIYNYLMEPTMSSIYLYIYIDTWYLSSGWLIVLLLKIYDHKKTHNVEITFDTLTDPTHMSGCHVHLAKSFRCLKCNITASKHAVVKAPTALHNATLLWPLVLEPIYILF